MIKERVLNTKSRLLLPTAYHLLSSLLFLPSLLSAQPWKLLGRLDASAGQYYFEKSAGSLNGYGDLDIQLAKSFSPQSGLFISERSVYTGFKQVNELAGGGTLFQQSLDNSLGFKWIRRFEGGYSFKPRISAKNQLFRETNDEKWGKGLYDFTRYEAGLTWERKTRWGLSVPWTYQFAYDFYFTNYTRFKSLANQFGAELSAPDPGARVLDTFTNQISYRTEMDFPGFASGWLLYSLSLVNFTGQKVVNSEGKYLDSKRTDSYQTLGAGVSKRLSDWQRLGRIRPFWALSLVATNSLSNQNHFDSEPKRLKFVDSHYNYWEVRASPSIGATFLKMLMNVRVGYEFGFRPYTGRLAQTADGTYTDNKLTQYFHGLFLDASYPLWRNLDMRVRGNLASSRSNNKFEQTYRYNYTSSNYFAGVAWRL